MSLKGNFFKKTHPELEDGPDLGDFSARAIEIPGISAFRDIESTAALSATVTRALSADLTQ